MRPSERAQRAQRQAGGERRCPPEPGCAPEPVEHEQRQDHEEAVERLQADDRVVRPQRWVHGREERGHEAGAVTGDPAAEEADEHDGERAEQRGGDPVLDLRREAELGRQREEHGVQRRVERRRFVPVLGEEQEGIREPVAVGEELGLPVVEPLVGQRGPADAVLHRAEDVPDAPRGGPDGDETEPHVEPGHRRHSCDGAGDDDQAAREVGPTESREEPLGPQDDACAARERSAARGAVGARLHLVDEHRVFDRLPTMASEHRVERVGGERHDVVGMVHLEVDERGERVRQRRAVGRGHREHPGGRDERVQTVEERPAVVEVLDHLARDHQVGRCEAEGADGVGVAAVDRVRVVAAGAGAGDAFVVEIETDELAADDARCSWSQASASSFIVWQPASTKPTCTTRRPVPRSVR